MQKGSLENSSDFGWVVFAHRNAIKDCLDDQKLLLYQNNKMETDVASVFDISIECPVDNTSTQYPFHAMRTTNNASPTKKPI